MRYLLKENRYIRVKSYVDRNGETVTGSGTAQYFQADPDHPLVIEMEDEVRVFDHETKKWKVVPFEDPRLIPFTGEVASPPLIPTYAKAETEAVPSAAKVQGPQPQKRTRIADA